MCRPLDSPENFHCKLVRPTLDDALVESQGEGVVSDRRNRLREHELRRNRHRTGWCVSVIPMRRRATSPDGSSSNRGTRQYSHRLRREINLLLFPDLNRTGGRAN